MSQNNHKTDKKTAILEATMALVAEQGFDIIHRPLFVLTIGPIIWLLRDIHSGLIPPYNPGMMGSVVETYWDGVKR